jgi:hypothetical protein
MLKFAPHRAKIALHVLVTDEVIEQMIAISSDPESETGGVLVGRYLDDGSVARIELASSPPGDSAGGLDWFERGKDGLADLLREQWDLPERRYYVGEWHFHPLGRAEPSQQDRKQIFEIGQDRNYRCRRPVLLIVSPATLRRRTARVFLLSDEGELIELFGVREGSC